MSIFFYFLNLISLIFFSNQQQNNYIDEYFNINSTGQPLSDDCLCNLDPKACNYLCCCDDKCSDDTKRQWRERSKCIDEKDTVGIFSDRCIEQHLMVFYNKRRGLKKEEATEDISNSNKMIKNFCFSMDNSKTMSRDIQTVNFKTPVTMPGDNQIKIDSNSQDYLSINDIDNQPFSNNEHFSLYSGIDCNHFREIEKFTNANFTCSMNREKNSRIREAINNNIRINDKLCNLTNVYKLENGLLNYQREQTITSLIDSEFIVEIEFIIKMQNYDASDLQCSINLIKTSSSSDGNILFKNSVIFSNRDKVPYRYSGTNGYLNGYPLKILSKQNNQIFNEYYIVGRNQDGDCRNKTDDDMNNYLYYDDKPFLFNQDYIYKCHLSETDNIAQTILYQRLDNIQNIAKYGDSNYQQINNDNYWINVTNNIDLNNRNNTYIKMNIYLGTKKIGVNSFKYIYKVILNNIKGDYNTLSLDIKYYDLDKTTEHEEKPNYPTFIPSMPADLLDPLIYSQVDK